MNVRTCAVSDRQFACLCDSILKFTHIISLHVACTSQGASCVQDGTDCAGGDGTVLECVSNIYGVVVPERPSVSLE